MAIKGQEAFLSGWAQYAGACAMSMDQLYRMQPDHEIPTCSA